MSIYWRTVCRETSGRPVRITSFYEQYCDNIEHLLNDGIISLNSFKSFVNEYPSSIRGNVDSKDFMNITFAQYLSTKISKIKEFNSGDIHITVS